MLSALWNIIYVLALAERAWKHWMVVRFFRRTPPTATAEVAMVSILQPVVSGDPTLRECLERTLRMRTGYPLEWIWLLDEGDAEAMQICRNLKDRYSWHSINLVTLPLPRPTHNAKMSKLIAGERLARGDVICVLDDDTVLPDHGLEMCLPYLDQPGVGLAFGLPYYESFMNMWSRLVALFVNGNSLLTYIPYLSLTEPFAINGMFYLIRRNVLTGVGGFTGLEGMAADDFAIAHRMRSHGLRLAQSPLRHGINTYVRGPRHYWTLMQRWLIFPRESILRYVSHREKALVVGAGLLPALFPLLLIARLALRPSRRLLGQTLAYFGYTFAIFAHFNRAYLRRASPWRHTWLVPVAQILLPIQLIAALLSPQRMNWRGRVMQVERGGGFHTVRQGGDRDASLA